MLKHIFKVTFILATYRVIQAIFIPDQIVEKVEEMFYDDELDMYADTGSQELKDLFVQFVQKYHKKYASVEEIKLRYELFKLKFLRDGDYDEYTDLTELERTNLDKARRKKEEMKKLKGKGYNDTNILSESTTSTDTNINITNRSSSTPSASTENLFGPRVTVPYPQQISTTNEFNKSSTTEAQGHEEKEKGTTKGAPPNIIENSDSGTVARKISENAPDKKEEIITLNTTQGENELNVELGSNQGNKINLTISLQNLSLELPSKDIGIVDLTSLVDLTKDTKDPHIHDNKIQIIFQNSTFTIQINGDLILNPFSKKYVDQFRSKENSLENDISSNSALNKIDNNRIKGINLIGNEKKIKDKGIDNGTIPSKVVKIRQPDGDADGATKIESTTINVPQTAESSTDMPSYPTMSGEILEQPIEISKSNNTSKETSRKEEQLFAGAVENITKEQNMENSTKEAVIKMKETENFIASTTLTTVVTAIEATEKITEKLKISMRMNNPSSEVSKNENIVHQNEPTKYSTDEYSSKKIDVSISKEEAAEEVDKRDEEIVEVEADEKREGEDEDEGNGTEKTNIDNFVIKPAIYSEYKTEITDLLNTPRTHSKDEKESNPKTTGFFMMNPESMDSKYELSQNSNPNTLDSTASLQSIESDEIAKGTETNSIDYVIKSATDSIKDKEYLFEATRMNLNSLLNEDTNYISKASSLEYETTEVIKSTTNSILNTFFNEYVDQFRIKETSGKEELSAVQNITMEQNVEHSTKEAFIKMNEIENFTASTISTAVVTATSFEASEDITETLNILVQMTDSSSGVATHKNIVHQTEPTKYSTKEYSSEKLDVTTSNEEAYDTEMTTKQMEILTSLSSLARDKTETEDVTLKDKEYLFEATRINLNSLLIGDINYISKASGLDYDTTEVFKSATERIDNVTCSTCTTEFILNSTESTNYTVLSYDITNETQSRYGLKEMPGLISEATDYLEEITKTSGNAEDATNPTTKTHNHETDFSHSVTKSTQIINNSYFWTEASDFNVDTTIIN